MSSAKYKIVSAAEYIENHKKTYPHARSNSVKSEYVISCNFGEGDMNHDEIVDYINKNWPSSNESLDLDL